MTEELFRDDAYARACEAVVTEVLPAGIVLDRTVFYATGGGQPGDTGTLRAADGRVVRIVDCIKERESGKHLHVSAEDAPAEEEVAAEESAEEEQTAEEPAAEEEKKEEAVAETEGKEEKE